MNTKKDWNPYDVYKSSIEDTSKLLWMTYILSPYKSEVGMLVKVDDSTASFLSGYYYNWLTLMYLVPIHKNKAQREEPGVYKLQLHGIDDTNMSAWIDKAPLSEIIKMWDKIEQFILDPELGQLEDGVNGELLLEYCQQVFPVEYLDYN